jgi:hypothetical protein
MPSASFSIASIFMFVLLALIMYNLEPWQGLVTENNLFMIARAV